MQPNPEHLIYAASGRRVYAIDRNRAELLWQITLPGVSSFMMWTPPMLLIEQGVLFAGYRKRVAMLDALTGDLLALVKLPKADGSFLMLASAHSNQSTQMASQLLKEAHSRQAAVAAAG